MIVFKRRSLAAVISRMRRPGMWLGAAMIATAAAGLVAGGRVDRLPIIIAATAGRADASFTSVFALDIALAIVVQLPMTIALGATFPLAIAMTSAVGEAAAVLGVVCILCLTYLTVRIRAVEIVR